ncbi:hypothetical protein RCL1_002034 [Eukaryota sp. TZLM3-RCL]
MEALQNSSLFVVLNDALFHLTKPDSPCSQSIRVLNELTDGLAEHKDDVSCYICSPFFVSFSESLLSPSFTFQFTPYPPEVPSPIQSPLRASEVNILPDSPRHTSFYSTSPTSTSSSPKLLSSSEPPHLAFDASIPSISSDFSLFESLSQENSSNSLPLPNTVLPIMFTDLLLLLRNLLLTSNYFLKSAVLRCCRYLFRSKTIIKRSFSIGFGFLIAHCLEGYASRDDLSSFVVDFVEMSMKGSQSTDDEISMFLTACDQFDCSIDGYLFCSIEALRLVRVFIDRCPEIIPHHVIRSLISVADCREKHSLAAVETLIDFYSAQPVTGKLLNLDTFLLEFAVKTDQKSLISTIMSCFLYTSELDFSGLIICKRDLFASLIYYFESSLKSVVLTRNERQNCLEIIKLLFSSWAGLSTILSAQNHDTADVDLIEILIVFLSSSSSHAEIITEVLKMIEGFFNKNQSDSQENSSTVFDFDLVEVFTTILAQIFVEKGLLTPLFLLSSSCDQNHCSLSKSIIQSINYLIPSSQQSRHSLLPTFPVVFNPFPVSISTCSVSFLSDFSKQSFSIHFQRISDLIKSSLVVTTKLPSQWDFNAINEIFNENFDPFDPSFWTVQSSRKFVDRLVWFYTPGKGNFCLLLNNSSHLIYSKILPKFFCFLTANSLNSFEYLEYFVANFVTHLNISLYHSQAGNQISHDFFGPSCQKSMVFELFPVISVLTSFKSTLLLLQKFNFFDLALEFLLIHSKTSSTPFQLFSSIIFNLIDDVDCAFLLEFLSSIFTKLTNSFQLSQIVYSFSSKLKQSNLIDSQYFGSTFNCFTFIKRISPIIIDCLFQKDDVTASCATFLYDCFLVDESILTLFVQKFQSNVGNQSIFFDPCLEPLLSAFLTLSTGFRLLDSVGWVRPLLQKSFDFIIEKYTEDVELRLLFALNKSLLTVNSERNHAVTDVEFHRKITINPLLIGQLSSTVEGCQFLKSINFTNQIFDSWNSPKTSLLRKRALIWTFGHLISSSIGFQNFENFATNFLKLIEAANHSSLIGTYFLAAKLISRHPKGREFLKLNNFVILNSNCAITDIYNVFPQNPVKFLSKNFSFISGEVDKTIGNESLVEISEDEQKLIHLIFKFLSLKKKESLLYEILKLKQTNSSLFHSFNVVSEIYHVMSNSNISLQNRRLLSSLFELPPNLFALFISKNKKFL